MPAGQFRDAGIFIDMQLVTSKPVCRDRGFLALDAYKWISVKRWLRSVNLPNNVMCIIDSIYICIQFRN